MIKIVSTYEQLVKNSLRIPHNLPYSPSQSLGDKNKKSNYQDILEVSLDDNLLELDYEYRIDGDFIQFLDDALPKQKIYTFEIKAYVDLTLFMKIYTSNKAQLAIFLTSSDYKERALAEMRYREIENNVKFQEHLKEVLDENNKKSD